MQPFAFFQVFQSSAVRPVRRAVFSILTGLCFGGKGVRRERKGRFFFGEKMKKSAKPRKGCVLCGEKAVLKRPRTGKLLCKECFFASFEAEVHETVIENKLFVKGDKVALGASGGKDSTVLAHVLNVLNKRYDYGVELLLLSIDEGISGYRDDSLETVKRNCVQYDLPLTILSYKDLYNWSMDEIVESVGRRNNCTFCGVFRRQALDRGALKLGANKIATGHNADDVAETVLMNLLRGDMPRLSRCTSIVTGDGGPLPRCKPMMWALEKEIVMYAYFKKLDYFSTECLYSPNAYRGFARDYVKDLEFIRPEAILDLIRAGKEMVVYEKDVTQVLGKCVKCGYMTSGKVCKACILLEGLNSKMEKSK
jgi:cytoplasmic tRNA 2-thiolation protein 1